MKKNMLLSVIAVTLICALAGAGTMAWFTSQASSAENTFVAGTLHLGGYTGQGFENGLFAAISADNMQPGEKRELPPIRIKNIGSLPLKVVRFSGSEPAPDTLFLARVMDVTVKMGAEVLWSGLLADLFSPTGGYLDKEIRMDPEDEATLAVVIHMAEGADNDYQGLQMSCKLHLDAFQANTTNCLVVDSLGNPIKGAFVKYYLGGWHDLGLTGSDGRIAIILPPGTGNTTFQIWYANSNRTYVQDIRYKSTFVFGTNLTTVILKDSEGNPIPNALAGVQFAPVGGSYVNFGITDANGKIERELIPGDYLFYMSHRGVRSETVTQNITANPTVLFQTGKVISDTGTCTGYCQSSWMTFTNGMELLRPNTNDGKLTFRYSGSAFPDTPAEIISGGTIHIH